MMGEDRRNNEKAADELTNTKQTRSLSSCSRRAFLAGIGAGLGGVSPFVANASASVSALPVSLEGAQREAEPDGAPVGIED